MRKKSTPAERADFKEMLGKSDIVELGPLSAAIGEARKQKPEAVLTPLIEARIRELIREQLEELSLQVKDGDFTNPNQRSIKLKLGDAVLSYDSFDVVQKTEYDG